MHTLYGMIIIPNGVREELFRNKFNQKSILELLTHLTQGESSVHLRFAPSGGLAAAGY